MSKANPERPRGYSLNFRRLLQIWLIILVPCIGCFFAAKFYNPKSPPLRESPRVTRSFALGKALRAVLPIFLGYCREDKNGVITQIRFDPPDPGFERYIDRSHFSPMEEYKLTRGQPYRIVVSPVLVGKPVSSLRQNDVILLVDDPTRSVLIKGISVAGGIETVYQPTNANF